MNRQIKFRVWDDQRKQYRDDAISFQTEENNIVEVSFENGEDHFIKKDGFISYPSSQIQQFTGLHDKSGKEIFEGDVIKPLKVLNATLRQVVFLKGGFWAYRDDNDFYALDFYDGDSCEIIGNVFENPDLVKL